MTDRSVRPRHKLRKAVLGLAVALVVLMLLEGLCSLLLIATDVVSAVRSQENFTPLLEEVHCEYDRELGWINKPDTHIQDFYGPGKSITINSDRFRGLENYIGKKPADRFRLVCLGDSFTLGYGVDDTETFPYSIEAADRERLQVVNMGQGGYSVGQSYLWLKRVGDELEADGLVAVFIVEDFRRLMVSRTVNGYGTPRFYLENGRLRVGNIPVPQKQKSGVFRDGQVAEILLRHSSLVRSMRGVIPQPARITEEEALATGLTIIRELHAFCRERRIPFALALTPTLPELSSLKAVAGYRTVASLLNETARRDGFPFVDLRSVILDFDSPGEAYLEEAYNHYSPLANRSVADRLRNWLGENFEHFPGPDHPGHQND